VRILWPITDPRAPLAGLPYAPFVEGSAWNANKRHKMKPSLPPIVRPEPSLLWEAVRGALALACIFIALAVIVGGCWALGW